MPAQVRSRRVSKLGEHPELLEAGVDVGASQGPEALHAEFLAAKTAEHGAIDYSAAQDLRIDVAPFEIEAAFGEIADESAREAVARAGGVKDLLEQITGDDEMLASMKKNSAVLAALDDQCARPHLVDLGGGALQIVSLGQHARLGIVNEQEVPVADGIKQLLAVVLDPVIHGVAAHQSYSVHLLAHAALERGLYVAE